MSDAVGGCPPASAIADVLALRGLDGWLTPPLEPVVPAPMPVHGRAVTVELELDGQGRLGDLREVLSGDLEGAVVVLAGAAELEGAVWGEILSLAAAGRGAKAVAVDGRVRDRAAMEALGLPVYARGEAVVGPQGRASVRAVGGPVTVAGVAVEPGDLVVVDAGGLVRVPAARADGVVTDAARYAAGEDGVLGELGAGAPLRWAYRHKQAAVAALDAAMPSPN